MVNIALVEDEQKAAELLKECLDTFAAKEDESFHFVHFCNAEIFLSNHTENFDIVFMDIELPGFNGMEAAAKLRQRDKNVIIIFVTNMAQFAVKGYEVGALDFIVKPFTYYNFAMKLHRALDALKSSTDIEVVVKTDNNLVRLRSSRITYVEVIKHVMIFYSLDGEFKSYGSLIKIEQQLKNAGFTKCNSCYLVNLRYVSKIIGYTAVVFGKELQISHPKRQAFLNALNNYLGAKANVKL